MMDYSFRDPLFLSLLIALILVIVWVYYLIKKNRYAPRLRVSSKRIWLGKSHGNLKFSPRFFSILLYAVGLAFLIIAFARPQTSFNKINRTVEGIDIMLVLDISASMRIEDFRDMNRFDTAKMIMKEFVLGRSSDKIGLEIFSGEPATLIPPTLDYSLLVESLANTEIGDLKDGTAIGDALATAVGRLKESNAKSRIIILVTDGDSNIGQVDPLTAGELAKGFGIRVYSIAIGREGRVAMPFVQKDVFGRQVKTYQYFDSSINPELLKQISKSTEGKFYRVQDDVNAFRDVFKDIDQLEKTKIVTTEQVKFNEHYIIFLKIGFIILIVTFFLQLTILRVYP